MRVAWKIGFLAVLMTSAATHAGGGKNLRPHAALSYVVSDGGIAKPLAGLTGDAERGRAIVLDRAVGNCLICHQVPIPSERFQGELGPDLAGVGSRLTEARIRMTLVDQSRLNPDTLMPPYHRTSDLKNVAEAYKGRPVLSAQQIEDVVAWLVSLK